MKTVLRWYLDASPAGNVGKEASHYSRLEKSKAYCAPSSIKITRWDILSFKAEKMAEDLNIYIVIATHSIMYQIHIPAIFKTCLKTWTVRDQREYIGNFGECDRQTVLTYTKFTRVCFMTTHTHSSLHNTRLIMASPLPPQSFPHFTIQFHL